MTDASDSAAPLVTLDVTRAGVAVVRLNRPERHNCFNPDVIGQLADHFDAIKSTGTIRAVLLEGSGKSFSAGADLEWMRRAGDYTYNDNVEDGRALAHMLQKLYLLPMPTIALVNGRAMGGGLGLVSACDTAIAVKTAEFSFSEVRLGLSPATISPYCVNAIGPRWARHLFTTGKFFNAEKALQIGLIHEIVEDLPALAQAAEETVSLIFKAAPGAIAASKKLVRDVEYREINHNVIQRTAEELADRRSDDEGREGVAAFLEKRKPYWAE